jgi:hypothetical protein
MEGVNTLVEMSDEGNLESWKDIVSMKTIYIYYIICKTFTPSPPAIGMKSS